MSSHSLKTHMKAIEQYFCGMLFENIIFFAKYIFYLNFGIIGSEKGEDLQ